MEADPAVLAFALAVLALWTKGVLLSGYQVRARFRARQFAKPEDARLVGVEVSPSEPPGVERAADAWRNELENTPIFLFFAAALLLLGAAPPTFPLILLVYVTARAFHTVAQVRARQPARTIAWLIGLGSTIWLAAGLVSALLPHFA